MASSRHAERLRFGYLTYGLERPHFGVGRSVFELGKALAERADCEPVFLTPYGEGPFRQPPFHSARLPGSRLLPAMMALGALEIPWVARQEGLELVHDPVGISPFLPRRLGGGFRRVVTLHDAIPWLFPETQTAFNTFVHTRYLPALLPNVDAVITDSEASKRDIVRFLPVPAERVRVVPLAAHGSFRPLPRDAAAAVARRYGLESPYLLYVGALEPRKNVPMLLRVFARLRARFANLTLAIGGRPAWKFEEIFRTLDQLGLGDAVRFTGFVPDAHLPGLYSAASAFCFPSLYEGFGLPVLEALACGTPTVCSNSSSLPEVAGEAALLVEPTNEAAWEEALGRVLADEGLASELRSRGPVQAARFSWERTAARTVEVYRAVLPSGPAWDRCA